MESARLQCINNHYVKYDLKEWMLLELQITQTRHPISISDEKMSKFNNPQKWKKKRAQNRRLTSSICEQS